MGSAILVDGREVACNARVTASQHCRFTALGKRAETRAVVWHWTAGRGLGPQVFRTVRERGLSVHFSIDPDGLIHQFADAALRCSHAGSANSYSVGVEQTNPALLSASDGFARDTITEQIHGRRVAYLSQTDAQVESARELAKSLSAAFGLPLDIPREPDGSLIRRVMTTRELAAFRGHIGHYHVTEQKTDPGPTFLEKLVGT